MHDSRLDSGLRVIVVPHEGPRAATWLWLEAGTSDENDGTSGVAHFLEHLLFKGTPSRGIGVASAEIETAGGDLNAFTSRDHTVLQASTRAADWTVAVDVLADMAIHATIDPAELERERDVVLDEIRAYDQEVDSVVQDRLRAELWPNHAYGRPVLGVASSVTPLGPSEVARFRADHWGPGRATLIVTGPVQAEAVRTLAARCFADWSEALDRDTRPVESGSHPGRVVRIQQSFDTADCQIGWRGPAVDHPDVHAVVLLAAVLGWSDASLMSERLQLDQSLVSAPWCSFSAGRLAGNLQLGFSPAENDLPKALSEVAKLIEGIQRGELSSTRLNRTREALLAQTLFSHETVDGVVSDAAWFAARLGRPDASDAHVRALRAVGPRDVVRAAQNWMGTDSGVLVYSDPDIDLAVAKRAWKRPGRTRAQPSLEPMARTLGNGVRILVLPDAGRVACARLAIVGGALAIGGTQAGLGAGWTDLMRSGCGPWDAIAFRRHLDSLGATFGAGVGSSLLHIRCSFLATELEEAMDLLGQAVPNPHFDPLQWKRIQEELIDDLLGLPDRPDDIAERAQDAALWAGHPWRLPWGGTEASLQRLSASGIRRWHLAQLDPSEMVMAIAGGVDGERALDLATRWMEQLKPVAGLAERAAPGPIKHRRMTRRGGQQQATVIAMVRTGGTHDADRRALELAAAVLDGAVGRLFLVLREQMALGYDVWASHDVGLDGGAFTAGVSCAPENATDAHRALLVELRRLVDQGPSPAELHRCRSLLAGELESDLQQVSARASICATGVALGRPWQQQAIEAQRAAVSAADVQRALAAAGMQDPLVLTVLPR